MDDRTRSLIVRGFLVLAGVVFLAVGLPGLTGPQALLARVGMELPAVDAMNEARAMYGGFQLAIAGLFLAGAFRPRLWRPLIGLWLVMIVGLIGGRLVSLALDGPPVAFARTLLTFEVLGLFAGVVVLRLCPREPGASASDVAGTAA